MADSTTLPDGWTAHIAPTGHTYYYNASVKKSTYVKPVRPAEMTESPNSVSVNTETNSPTIAGEVQGLAIVMSGGDVQSEGKTSKTSTSTDPTTDRPKYKIAIPDAEPWVEVYTKQRRKFYHNTSTGKSYWTAPAELEELLSGLFEEDGTDDQNSYSDHLENESGSEVSYELERDDVQMQEDLEFGEDDIAWQLQAMEEEGRAVQEVPDDTPEFTQKEKSEIFKRMLKECSVDPFRTWDSELEKIKSDPRYLIFGTTHQRKATFEEFCTEEAHKYQNEKAAVVKEDPRVGFLRLAKQAWQKSIYFQDFKRKYKKENAYKDFGQSDNEREKLFRALSALLRLGVKERKTAFLELLSSTAKEELNADPRYYGIDESLAETLCKET